MGSDLERAAGLRVKRCAATRKLRPRAELVRIVVDQDGVARWDGDERLGGRGAWVSPAPEILDGRNLGRIVSRALKRPVATPDGLAYCVRNGLRGRLRGHLACAKRSGDVDLTVALHEIGAEMLKNCNIALVICDKNAHPTLSERAERACAAAGAACEKLDLQAVGPQIGVAGKSCVVLRKSGLATKVWADCRRLVAMEEPADALTRQAAIEVKGFKVATDDQRAD